MVQTQTRKKAEKYGIVEAGTIIGETVVNRQDENLGEIHEIMLDAREGRIAYAVLSSGGFLGMGNKLFAIPWEALEFASSEQKLILDVDKERLKAAPGFDKDEEWPDFADRSWGSEVHDYYGLDPYWTA